MLGWVGVPSEGFIHLFGGDESTAHTALMLTLDVLAELGVILLLFFVGLETRVAELVQARGRALLVMVPLENMILEPACLIPWRIGLFNTSNTVLCCLFDIMNPIQCIGFEDSSKRWEFLPVVKWNRFSLFITNDPACVRSLVYYYHGFGIQ